MTNWEQRQTEFNFWNEQNEWLSWHNNFSQEVLDETSANKWNIKSILEPQWSLDFTLSHLFWWLINKWEYYWVRYFELKNKNYSYKSEWKITLVGFWINDNKNVRYIIVKLWWKKYKINFWEYKYNKNARKVHDWSFEWFEVSWINLESFKIDSMQKSVSKWFSEVKPTNYFSYLLQDNAIKTTMNFSDYIKTVAQEFLRDLLKQL